MERKVDDSKFRLPAPGYGKEKLRLNTEMLGHPKSELMFKDSV